MMWEHWNTLSIINGECLVCMESDICIKLDACNHKVCGTCWSQYIQSKLGNRFDLKCCGQGCPFKINESVFRKLIQLTSSSSDSKLLQNSFQQFLSTLIQPVPDLVELFSSESVNPPSFIKRMATASSSDYYHYNCCAEEDAPWGCAYRDLQCIISNFNHNRIIHTEMPTLIHIQVMMDKLGHRQNKFLGSTGREAWIEPPDAALILKELFGIEGFQRKFGFQDPSQVKEVKQQLWQHFSEHKTPVMIDDSVMAYNILGIRETSKGQIQVLRFDPHTTENYMYQHFKDALSKNTYGVGSADINKNNNIPLDDVGWISFEDVFASLYKKNWMMLFPYAK